MPPPPPDWRSSGRSRARREARRGRADYRPIGSRNHPRGPPNGREWHEQARAERYLAQAPDIPWWQESERALVEHLPADVDRFLDIGTGDGRLIDLVRGARPGTRAVGLDFSPAMLAAAAGRFAGTSEVTLVVHDLTEPLPPCGSFDLVVSDFTIHRLEDSRKRSSTARSTGCCTRRPVPQPRARRLGYRPAPRRVHPGDRRGAGRRGSLRPPGAHLDPGRVAARDRLRRRRLSLEVARAGADRRPPGLRPDSALSAPQHGRRAAGRES